MTITITKMLSGKLRNHLSLMADDILPIPIIIRDAQKISKNHPINDLNGVRTGEMFLAGT